MKASVLILTHDEEINLPRCLAALSGFEDIVVVDSGSQDRTCEIAESSGARVLYRPFDDFASQRNFGLEAGDFKNEYVLHLDADEVVTPQFVRALDDLKPTEGIDAYRVPSKTMLNEKWLRHAGMYPTYQVRLGHRDRLRFKKVGHGQREDLPPQRVATFPEPYLHYNFSHGLSKWFIKHVRYAKDEAHQSVIEGRERTALKALISPDRTERRRALKSLANRMPLASRPPLRFLYIVLGKGGFLDGRAGIQYALMLSAYEAMTAAFVMEELANDR